MRCWQVFHKSLVLFIMLNCIELFAIMLNECECANMKVTDRKTDKARQTRQADRQTNRQTETDRKADI